MRSRHKFILSTQSGLSSMKADPCQSKSLFYYDDECFFCNDDRLLYLSSSIWVGLVEESPKILANLLALDSQFCFFFNKIRIFIKYIFPCLAKFVHIWTRVEDIRLSLGLSGQSSDQKGFHRKYSSSLFVEKIGYSITHWKSPKCLILKHN